MVIHNQIFEAFRVDKAKEEKYIKFLTKRGFLVTKIKDAYESNR
jgi:SOS response regulatory protein OraA/RecX